MDAPERAGGAPETPEPRTSDEAVRRATGRGREEWFALLDAWGATAREHGEIAEWLGREHRAPGWWAQNVTVDYEQARGLREPGSGRDGLFSVGATKTVGVAVERLYEAFVDPQLRERWLPGVALRERTSQPGRSARFDWEDGATRVLVNFTAKGEAKSQVAVEHERLPDSDAAAEIKAYWRAALVSLKALLESEMVDSTIHARPDAPSGASGPLPVPPRDPRVSGTGRCASRGRGLPRRPASPAPRPRAPERPADAPARAALVESTI